ncbi:MAG TPA: helix-turn-helix domain-containing protein [Trebonia sp.]|nr:helix-turn-helix domain-containing protein [Trebonia sp.]
MDDPETPDPERIATQADFGRELRALRERAERTIREVAKVSGVPHSTVGDYCSGRHLPMSADLLEKVLRACGVTDPVLAGRWKAALQRARRAPGRRTDIPYRGLARFERQDARWFFGREDVTDLIVSRAAEESPLPLVLVGPSGAGKSSLLRAGLLPRLPGPAEVFEPTAAPADDLSALLAPLPVGGGRPTLVVDQFEAVFTQCADETQRRDFIARVCDLARGSLVLLALRADFYDHVIRYPGLAAALQHRQVVLGPMTVGQVRRAITEPARVAKVHVEDGLVEVLLADLAPDPPGGQETGDGHEAGALPLLSHAMLATWENSRGGTLTVADYRASGGIEDALTRTAEKSFGSLPAEHQQLARRLFLRLVHVTGDLPPSRATVSLTELRDSMAGDAWEVLARFVDERMITVDADTVAITHDALLTAWPRLRSWIESGTDGLRTRRRITEAARAWEEAGRENAALWRGSQLAVATDWASDDDNRATLPPVAAEFVAASVAEDRARQRAERRRTRWLQGIVAVLGVLILVTGLLAGYVFKQRDAVTVAQHETSSGEAALEADQVRAQDPALAAQLSVGAYDLVPGQLATASLIESSGTPLAGRIVDSSGVVQWTALSPDGKLIAAAGANGTLRLWDAAAPSHVTLVSDVVPASPGEPLYVAKFSPDGKLLAAAGAGRVVKLWNVADPARPVYLGELTGPANTIYSVAFSPDGGLLAAASADNTVRLWNVADPAQAKPVGGPLTGLTGAVESVAFAPGGTVLAAASGNSGAPGRADDAVALWNVANPARPVPFANTPLRGPADPVSGVAFSPDGRTLAAASQDHKVWLWKIAAAKVTQGGTLTGAANWVNTVAFSPDGKSVAAGTSDASVLVWDLATRTRVATLPQTQPVTSVTWDGPRRVVTSDADGTISLWALPAPVLVTGNATTSLAYSPDGRRLVIGGTNAQLWNPATRSLEVTASLPALVNGMAYSPDGRYVAVALGNGTAQLRDGATLAPVSAPFLTTATGTAETVAFSPDGKLLVTGSDDGLLRVFSLADPARPRLLAVRRDSGDYVYTVAFAPDGTTLAAASTDNYTRLWDIADPADPRQVATLGGLSSYAIGLAFTRDSRTLAVGSAAKTVQLWNVADPARPARLGAALTGPAGYVWAVAFSPDGRTLAAGVTDGTVWLWHVTGPARPSLIATLTGPAGHVYSLGYSPDGSQLAATSDDGTVHLWDTSPAAAAAAICADVGQPLSQREWSAYVPNVPYHAPCS